MRSRSKSGGRGIENQDNIASMTSKPFEREYVVETSNKINKEHRGEHKRTIAISKRFVSEPETAKGERVVDDDKGIELYKSVHNPFKSLTTARMAVAEDKTFRFITWVSVGAADEALTVKLTALDDGNKAR